ncbi:MAG: hypothetical protein EOM21_20210 [Gammaproteobacteria bacterium]|nr:hypothetical protein [Gammaproteobacteria bacterium]
MWNANAGRNDINNSNWQASTAAIKAKRDAEFKPGKFVAGLAGGIVAGGLGGAALGAFGAPLAAGTSAASAAPTSSALLAAPSGLGSGAGFSATAGSAGAGTAASSSGLGSTLLNSFSTKAALGGALKGGIGGYMSGGDLSSALKGAGLGAVTGGYGDALAGAAGLSGPGAKAFTGALTGASGGLATGNLKNAALGAALGGGSSYVTAGGRVPGLGQAAETIDWNQGGSSVLNPGSGILGDLTSGGSGMASLTGSGGKLGSLLKAGTSLYSGYQEDKTNDEIERKMLEAQQRASGMLSPYQQAGLGATNKLSDALMAGFNPGDLTQDPGYQFQLAEMQKGADAALSSQGMSQSGEAIKAAMRYRQGLADRTYNDAYQRWLAQNQQLAGLGNTGMNAAQGMGDYYSDMGAIQGLSAAAKQQNRSRMLSELLSGVGAFF